MKASSELRGVFPPTGVPLSIGVSPTLVKTTRHYNAIRYNAIVIASFKDKGTEDVFDGRATKEARRACPQNVWKVARRKLDQINQSVELDDLRSPPGNRLERLSGDREGSHSVRINAQYRICFKWTDEGAEEVEIVDYH